MKKGSDHTLFSYFGQNSIRFGLSSLPYFIIIIYFYFHSALISLPSQTRILFFSLAVTADGQGNDWIRERPLSTSRRSTREKNRWQFDQRRARRGRERKPSWAHTIFFCCCCCCCCFIPFLSFFLLWLRTFFFFYCFTLLQREKI